jgi:hypothetical protein
MGFKGFKIVKHLAIKWHTFQGMQYILNQGVRRLELKDRLPNDIEDDPIMDVSPYTAVRWNLPFIGKETTAVISNVSRGEDLWNVTDTVIV